MALARAVAREAQLVILDDSLSAVDAKTEQDILKMLRHNLAATTSIIVSHRMASVRHADQILVLQNGLIEGAGRHEDLIRTSNTYQRRLEMQVEGEA